MKRSTTFRDGVPAASKSSRLLTGATQLLRCRPPPEGRAAVCDGFSSLSSAFGTPDCQRLVPGAWQIGLRIALCNMAGGTRGDCAPTATNTVGFTSHRSRVPTCRTPLRVDVGFAGC